MGWTLGIHGYERDPFLDAYLLTVGRALLVATAYEKKCWFVMATIKRTEVIEAGGDFDAVRQIALALRNVMLGGVLKHLKAFAEITEAEINVLNRARETRNFIAHESTHIDISWQVPVKGIIEQSNKLIDAVDGLIFGDNLVSSWVYEIKEKEPAPDSSWYPERIRSWVFEPVDSYLKTHASASSDLVIVFREDEELASREGR